MEGKTKNQGSMPNEESDLLDRKALGSIQLCLSPLVTFNITKAKTTKYLMKTLATLYEKPSASNKVFLMKCLFNMKMVEGGYVADHLNEFNTITSQLSYVNVNFDEEIRALLMYFVKNMEWLGNGYE